MHGLLVSHTLVRAVALSTGANGSSLPATPPQARADDEEEEAAPEEEKLELQLAAGADILFKATAKLHTQKPGTVTTDIPHSSCLYFQCSRAKSHAGLHAL